MRWRPSVLRAEDGHLPVLGWDLSQGMLAISSAPRGGGVGERRWVINAQVPSDYARTDIDAHLDALATELGFEGPGVGFLTAAAVDDFTVATDGEVEAFATVGLQHPTWAAADLEPPGRSGWDQAIVGTINVVVFLPTRLDDAALVNAVTTATEAKAQALFDRGVPATGTASDAICILTPTAGPSERFAGPRSVVGAQLARAVHGAVLAGAAPQ
jgi:adenosylcobinamide amidohydrolase